MHGKRLRPVMEDYIQSNPNQNSSENVNSRPPPMRSVNNPMQNQQTNQNQNEPQKQRFFNPNQNKSVQPPQNFQQNQNYQQNQQNLNQEISYENSRDERDHDLKSQRSTHLNDNHAHINRGNIHEIYGEPHLHRTSQSHKKKFSDYMINPVEIPRPNQLDEIYRNPNKQNIYSTSEDIVPPHPNISYVVEETQNTSCRFMRPTLTKLPLDQSNLNSSNILFSLYLQPFAELSDKEKEIPKVDVNEHIFRCRRCNSYINSKYTIGFAKSMKRAATCNICNCENEFDNNNPAVKSDYFNSDYNGCQELISPTVDFCAPNNMKHATPFYPHYIFMIDITNFSYQLGFPSYIVNSINTNLDFFHNSANTFISIATYDHKSIQFFTLEKNEEVKAYIVSDINDPYCPIPTKKLFLNVINDRSSIEKLIEKINIFIQEKNNQFQLSGKAAPPGAVSTAAMAAGIDALKENGGRVMLFSCSNCSQGLGSIRTEDKEVKKDKNLLIRVNNPQLSALAESCLKNRTAVDLFILDSLQLDLANISLVPNLTGGQVHFYESQNNNVSELKLKFEKIHYDLSRIVSRPNYYDVKFMLRFSVGIDTGDIIGPFGKKLGEGFSLAACDPDYAFAYNLRLTESLQNNSKVHFQFVCLYIDNFNQRYLRIFNYTINATNDVTQIYTHVDVSALVKCSIMRDIVSNYAIDSNLLRENIVNRITAMLAYYRTNCTKNTPMAQLILPATVKVYPLYLHAFMRTAFLRKTRASLPTNLIINIMNRLLRDPIYISLKYLYPKLYRIDNIQNDQINFYKTEGDNVISNIGQLDEELGEYTKPHLLPLSLDHIDFDSAYLIDNSEVINVYVFNYLNEEFYQELFGVETFDNLLEQNIENLDESNTNDLNLRIFNIINQLRKENFGFTQPIKLNLLTNSSFMHPNLTNYLIEDQSQYEPNYVSFLCGIHQNIQKKMSG